MPRVTRILGRRAGAVGVALTMMDLWSRLPEHQRRQLIEQGRRHGTRIAEEAVRRSRELRDRRQ
jgi:hypothetical protein